MSYNTDDSEEPSTLDLSSLEQLVEVGQTRFIVEVSCSQVFVMMWPVGRGSIQVSWGTISHMILPGFKIFPL